MLRLAASLMVFAAGAVLAAAPQTAGSARITRITLERSGCPMDLNCPDYKLTLNGDGSVVFEGNGHVSAMGIHKRRIEPKTVEDLAHRFEEIHYFNLPGRVGGACTDAPLVTTSVLVGSHTNEVRNWECGSTQSLTELEDEIDRVSNSPVWIRGHLRLWLHWPWFHSKS